MFFPPVAVQLALLEITIRICLHILSCFRPCSVMKRYCKHAVCAVDFIVFLLFLTELISPFLKMIDDNTTYQGPIETIPFRSCPRRYASNENMDHRPQVLICFSTFISNLPH